MNRSHSDFEIIELSGELDIAGKKLLRDTLAATRGTAGIILDLSRVSYADSTALTELLRFFLQCREGSVPMAMVVATAQLERILRYAGLYDAFTIFADRDAAVRFLESRR